MHYQYLQKLNNLCNSFLSIPLSLSNRGLCQLTHLQENSNIECHWMSLNVIELNVNWIKIFNIGSLVTNSTTKVIISWLDQCLFVIEVFTSWCTCNMLNVTELNVNHCQLVYNVLYAFILVSETVILVVVTCLLSFAVGLQSTTISWAH